MTTVKVFKTSSESCRTCLNDNKTSDLCPIFVKSDSGVAAPIDVFTENEFINKYLFQYLNVSINVMDFHIGYFITYTLFYVFNRRLNTWTIILKKYV